MQNKLLILFFFALVGHATGQSEKKPKAVQTRSIHFEKKKIASESYETVGVFDVNSDKVPDIVSGGFWYEGPAYSTRHAIGAAKRYGEYYDDFSTIPLDVNGDGRTDFVTGGWFGGQLVWKQNPGDETEWQEHLIAEVGNIESTRSWDLDGDGIVEIVPNTPNDSLRIYRLLLDNKEKGTGKFAHTSIFGKHGHGIGFGDINGDGRDDLVIPTGWLEAPFKPFEDSWRFHPEFELGTASVPVLVVDVNLDGHNDLIVGMGHDYGLHWYEQHPGEKSSEKKWQKHAIDPFNSQYHTMEWKDLDGDGTPELITGKRYRAHNGKDSGGSDDLGLYYFRWNGENFSKQVIDYGAYGEGKGTGVYFSVADLNNDGKKDIIVAGKDGLTIYYNRGAK
ncbi:VCBS repeat-containing protein [Pricia sp. S334]|uniref:VCBS repeat-containing protein n=1 Tax=Pricia mediterranea TaxID=3076079 RepID=A0ABU3LAD9_9FLAO|nr:VCBS repeat-containing protein [Pricia sp. S334]MDT7830523.1 VCBS repeat-containing protein [Pricia sp. S334]